MPDHAKRPPGEALVDLRRRLSLLPPRDPARAEVIARAAQAYGISASTVYRSLRELTRPKPVRRVDHGSTKAAPQAEMERYAEIVAALKVRTSNKKGHRLSTRRAIELLEDTGVETPDGLVRAPKGVLKRPTLDRFMRSAGLDHARVVRPVAAVRFQAKRANELWHFDMSPSDLKHVKAPLWVEEGRGKPTLMLFSVVDDRSGTSYQEYRCVYGEEAEAALRFLFNAMAAKPEAELPFQGIPAALHMDNGPVSRAKVFQSVMGSLGVRVLTHMPPSTDERRTPARAKGKVERPFRTVKEAHESLGIADRLAELIADPRNPLFVTHSIADILRARMLAIACGYEDADDLDHLRTDPGFKLACGRLPDSGLDLCSQPTVSRWENAPTLREVARLTYAMVDTYCASYPRPPKAVTLDIDDTVDIVHGHQQMSLFNAHHHERCFMPIHVYDTASSRPVAILLRPGKTPSGFEVCCHVRRLVRRIRKHWPDTRLTLRGDGHYGRPEVMAWCEANAVDYIFGLPGNAVLNRLLNEAADDVRVRRAEAQAPVLRRYAEIRYGAKSWGQQRRVSARIEASTMGLDIRCVVTNLKGGSAEWLYDTLYCERGQAENLIKLHKGQLASDRTSCRSALANQVRLVLHTAAYWLMLTVRNAIPKLQPLATVEFTTLRLRLLKIAGRVTETATRIRIAFAAACPEAELFRGVARSLQLAGP